MRLILFFLFALLVCSPHHVTQRGNRREDVFFTQADRLRYLDLLGQYAVKHGLAMQAYCLMTARGGELGSLDVSGLQGKPHAACTRTWWSFRRRRRRWVRG